MAERPPSGKSSKVKTSAKSPAKTRRAELRRILQPSRTPSLRETLGQPELAPIAALVLLFVVSATTIIAGFRSQLPLSDGRVASEARVVRQDFQTEDPEGTARLRELERLQAPRVYEADEAVFREIDATLRSLPETLAAAQTFDQVQPEIRGTFDLDPVRFEAVRAEMDDGRASESWHRSVDDLTRLLRTNPLVGSGEYQLIVNGTAAEIELRAPDEGARRVPRRNAVNLGAEGQDIREDAISQLEGIARRAGFFGPRADVVVRRLVAGQRPTFVFNAEATEQLRDAAGRAIEMQVITHRSGQVVFAAGDRVSKEQRALAMSEHREFLAGVPNTRRALWVAGIAGVVGLIVVVVGGVLRRLQPRLVRNPWRVLALVMLSGLLLLVSCWTAMEAPQFIWPLAMGPTVFLAMILVIAYDRRVALLVTAAQAAMVGLSLNLPVGFFVSVLVGTMVAAWKLEDIRTRNDVVRGGLYVALALGVSALVVGLVERPRTLPAVTDVLMDATGSAVAGFLAASLTLVILPTVERVFDVVTGMTLSELRDPKHPLLRQLQQRAPGTYNHSLNVATLAETAADSIGSDGLHVYVGALYHDIGKMNKPDYFVENQPRGFNKHDKLSPAMSLLVIVGHVKDGVELAREYGLPRSLHHYIETHHGTTLVEYFYDQAKRQADADSETERPEEIEYRYPGPKPRRKEAAILM
ncbi:MAG: HDIG domain-containing metalloprotein, partial [Planctomycetota bacterium]